MRSSFDRDEETTEMHGQGVPLGVQGPKGDQGDPGPKGDTGNQGPKGETGDSAFEEAVSLGFVGTPTDWIASLKGLKGDTGNTGAKGDQGIQGPKGDTGATGSKGDQGIQGLKGDKGDQGNKGDLGPQGESAYQVAQDAGFSGTVSAWLASLIGPKGDKGDTGPQGTPGTGLTNKGNWVAGNYNSGDFVFSTGSATASSMWIAKNTFNSTVQPNQDTNNWAEFVAPKGDTGPQGLKGDKGDQGDKGLTGNTGATPTVQVDSVVTGDAGTNAQVTNVGTPTSVSLKFTIPQGLKGDKGDKGDTGATGPALTNADTLDGFDSTQFGRRDVDSQFLANQNINKSAPSYGVNATDTAGDASFVYYRAGKTSFVMSDSQANNAWFLNCFDVNGVFQYTPILVDKSGNIKFNNSTVSINAGGTIEITGSQSYQYKNNNAPANSKYWRHWVADSDGSWNLETVNDGYSAAATFLRLYRAGNSPYYGVMPCSMTFGADAVPQRRLDVRGGGVVVDTNGAIGQYDMVAGNRNAGWRQDGSNVYLLFSDDAGSLAAARNATWNGYRPFTVSIPTGAVSMGHGLTVANGLTASNDSTTGGNHNVNGVLRLANDDWRIQSYDGQRRFYFSSNGATYARVVSSFRWQNTANGDVGSIDESGNLAVNGNLGAYSDGRLKSWLRPIRNASSLVKRMKGYYYVKDQRDSLGFIAQDMQKILPQLVGETEDGMLHLAYGNITAVLAESQKELMASLLRTKIILGATIGLLILEHLL